jgi:ribosomal protein L37E
MKSAIRTIEFICKMCGEGLKAYHVNTKDDNEIVECSYCGYENTLQDILNGE